MRYNLGTMDTHPLKQVDGEDLDAFPIPLALNDYCQMLLERIELLSTHITYMDDYLKAVTLEDPCFQYLLTIPGIGYILALTIYYEVGAIERFASARPFASYGRLIPSLSQSADKTRRGSGSKQGNHYLKWAFTQAANIAARYDPPCRKFRDKQANRHSIPAATMVAHCILVHKLATATFHILKEEKPFEMKKLFA